MKKWIKRLVSAFLFTMCFWMFHTVTYADSSSLLPNVSKSYCIKGYCYAVHDFAKKRVYVYWDESCTQRSYNVSDE